MAQLLKNNVFTKLASAATAGATTLSVVSAATFPTITGSDFFLLTLYVKGNDGKEATWEIVKVTAVSGNNLTVVRAQEGTAAVAWDVDTPVELRLTAATIPTKVDEGVLAHEAKADPHPQYTTPAEASAAAPVQSVAGKTGAVTLNTGDVAEGTNLYFTNARASAAAPVQSVFGRTGNVVAQQSDYDAFFTTVSEAAAAAPVQSVFGRTGNVVLNSGDVTGALGYTPPQPNGTGATGTWNINITGNAATSNTAATASNANALGGVAPSGYLRVSSTSSDPINGNFAIGTSGGRNFIQSHGGAPLDINPLGNTVTANGSGLVLNNGGTYGINITGNAESVDGFSASQSTLGNHIVVRDGNGYIFGNYINMTDDGNPGGGTSGITSFITKQGDNYYRSVSVTAAANRIRDGANGTWPISISGGIESTQASLGYSVSGVNIDFGGQGGPQVRGQGGGAAMMSFHRPGSYAINFGLGTDNQLRTGGWSRGGNFVILDSGNYGSYSNFGGGAVYGGIYYDGNNSGFYVDPASTSELNKVYYNSNMVSRNFGIGQVGLYDASRYQAVFSMGESYLLPANGTSTGNLYGIAWSHPNAGGTAGELNTHGALILENGGFLAAISGSIRCRDDMRAPIYYDRNDTSYYFDGASTSMANDFRANIFYDRLDTSYYAQPRAISFFNDFRPNIIYDRQNTGYYCDPNGTTYFNAFIANDVHSYGNVTAYSDVRLKTDIEPIQNALSKVMALNGVNYNRADIKNKRFTGVIAQEVEAVLPEAVETDSTGIKSVAYGNLVGLLIEAIKDQQNQINELKKLVGKV